MQDSHSLLKGIYQTEMFSIQKLTAYFLPLTFHGRTHTEYCPNSDAPFIGYNIFCIQRRCLLLPIVFVDSLFL